MARRPYIEDNSMSLSSCQQAQMRILNEFIERARLIIGLPTKEDVCHHAIDLLIVAYALKQEVRLGGHQ